MVIVGWVLVTILFILAFLGLFYPIIPVAPAALLALLAYGFFISFEPFTWVFWTIQILLLVLLFVADFLSTVVGVNRFGGTKAGIWGSTIGLLMGPFIIPYFGILLGPFLGAVLAELVIEKMPIKEAIRVGFGSVIGFLTSVLTKGFLLIVMVICFFVYVF